MKLSRKPRHWIALVIALITAVVAVWNLADFSGDPVPKWRQMVSSIGAPLTLCAVIFNLVLDGQEKDGGG